MVVVGTHGEKTCDASEKCFTYDYIVIGAGTAGGMVASKLAAELVDENILLIEEGIYSASYPPIDDMSNHFSLLTDPTIEKFYVTTPQANLNNRILDVPRAKATGGCQAHNLQVWLLGNENDLSQRWGNIEGWSLNEDIYPLFKEINDITYTGNQVDIASIINDDAIYQRYINSGINSGYPFNENPNNIVNGSSNSGVSAPIYQGERIYDEFGIFEFEKRHTSWTDFVEPILGTPGRRNNLDIKTLTRVNKLIVENDDVHNKTRVTGVSVSSDITFENATYYANKEVILSAGSYDSPKLLMLSGIGDCDELENEYNIECKVDIPGVGKNLIDHLAMFDILQFINRNGGSNINTSDDFDYGINQRVINTNEWRAPWEVIYIPSDSKYQLLSFIIPFDQENEFLAFWFGVELLHLTSAGTVKLQDNDPSSPPIIDHNYLDDLEDQQATIEAIRELRRIFYESGEFDDIFPGGQFSEISPGFGVQDDSEILNWAKNNLNSASHPMGTCKMGNSTSDDNMVVVDSRLRVKNIENLRVIDASIAPGQVSANIAPMTTVIGLKGANMIIEDYYEQYSSSSSSSSESH